MFEALEARRLLAFSVNISLADGVLRIDATRQRTYVDFFVDDGGAWVLSEGQFGIRSYAPNAFKKVIVNGGKRGDELDFGGCPVPIIMNGRGGDDILKGGFAGDTIDAGPGNDTFDTPWGADLLRGGEGIDRVAFDNRSANLKISLDGRANDGQFILDTFESMNIGADVENVTGGDGNDLIIGNTLSNVLSGGAGNDTIYGGAGDDRITGGAGIDLLLGEGGNDTLDAIDGGVDHLNGGKGMDRAGNDINDRLFKVEQYDVFG